MATDFVLSSALENLRSSDPESRERGLQAIERLGHSARGAVPTLVDALKARSREIQSAAARALAAIGSCAAPAIGPLVCYVHNDGNLQEPQNGRVALIVLLEPAITDEPAAVVESLGLALREGDATSRRAAVNYLGNSGLTSPSQVSMLINACFDVDPYVRIGAVDGLGRVGSMALRSCPVLVDVLNRDEADIPPLDIKAAAAHSLGRIGSGENGVISALEAALSSARRAVRINAAWALSQIDPEIHVALPVLMEEKSSQQDGTRSLALDALNAIDASRPENEVRET